ncbi:hypothetical protein CY34DRAFT_387976 [Suillus luteus UH-Slu-Lm8-n1]|uniref:Uncharacterized protein n=1 Tax=Suillus luteus UH-Slu-Lm8-n1 TaxID=930992 RepID=A0A0D0AVY2_9AGAM|nr:hypothetical protein CY34DRAFT_387976 [Suillus luteus UH-Slu-Lm8-n1]
MWSEFILRRNTLWEMLLRVARQRQAQNFSCGNNFNQVDSVPAPNNELISPCELALVFCCTANLCSTPTANKSKVAICWHCTVQMSSVRNEISGG